MSVKVATDEVLISGVGEVVFEFWLGDGTAGIIEEVDAGPGPKKGHIHC